MIHGSPFTLKPIRSDLSFGVQIENVDLGALSNEDVQKDLRTLFIREGLLVFRGIEDDDETQIRLSRIFGLPIPHPVREAQNGRDELLAVHYRPEDGWLIDVDGELRGQWLPWHSDLVYLDKINRGGILRPVRMPDRLGETGFIDQIAAYDRLPDALKTRIEGQFVKYKYDLDPARQRFGRNHNAAVVRYSPIIEAIQRRVDEFPFSYHPMVYEQELTGRKVLNVSP
ncbi:taurine catabolism dioxygenase TauD [Sphingobium cloacae]|uniref:Taurine catabolism dioxygenase TauD n=1 Tax=Sphingobium cloacae TaxID=120107 RepID=A0A1E1F6W7_9SPHN|nr:taurine catabolism dioxygenase TauD [Sphingobium cloacae]